MKPASRGRHLSVLIAQLTESDRGRGAVATIRGFPGSGKTTLLHELADHAERVGAVALCASAVASEREMPLRVVGQLAGGLALPTELSAGLRELEAELSTGLSCALACPVLSALCDWIVELGQDRTVVVTVDDVHHADEPSLTFLTALGTLLRRSRILLAVTEPLPGCGVAPRPSAKQLTDGASRQITLDGFTTEDLAGLLPGRSGLQAPARARHVHDLTGGHPELVEALLRDQQGDGAAAAAPGEEYRRAVRKVCARTGENAFHLARTLAALDETGLRPSVPLLSSLTKLDSDAVESALSALRAVGLTTEDGLRHPALRTAVLLDPAFTGRQALHEALATELYARGAAIRVVADQIAASDSVCHRWQVTVLRNAAWHAAAAAERGAAVRFLTLAERFGRGSAEHAEVVAELADGKWAVDPEVAARHFDHLVAAATDGRLGQRRIAVLVGRLLWDGRVGDAQRVAGAFAARVATPAGEEEAAIAHYTSLVTSMLCPRVPSPAPPRDPARLAAASPWLRGALELAVQFGNWDEPRAAELAEQILQSASAVETPWELIAIAHRVLVNTGRVELSEQLLATLGADAERRELRTSQAWLATLRADAALQRGDLTEAITRARAALDLLPARAWGVAIALPLATLALALTHCDRHDEAARIFEQVLPPATYQTVFAAYYLYARGRHFLALGKTQAALADFASCEVLERNTTSRAPYDLTPWRVRTAEALLLLGKTAQAVELLNRLRDDRHTRARDRGVALRLLAGTRDVLERPALLRESRDILEAAGDQAECARTMTDLALAHHALGEATVGRTLMRRVRQLARRTGAPLPGPASTAPDEESEPPEAGGMPPGWLTLTQAEQRVAALAAQGYRNRDIAEKIFVTVSTVEQHMTRIYRKLDIRCRQDIVTPEPRAPSDPLVADEGARPRRAHG